MRKFAFNAGDFRKVVGIDSRGKHGVYYEVMSPRRKEEVERYCRCEKICCCALKQTDFAKEELERLIKEYTAKAEERQSEPTLVQNCTSTV